jgi:YidC/Oxa1 family membrane protein insertase
MLKFNKRPLILVVILVLVFLVVFRGPVGTFDLILLQPMLNVLMLFSKAFFGSFGMAIIALTVLILVITAPLTRSQLRSAKAMQAVQPKIKELQKKYAKDKERLSQETMKLYRESGANPIGCMASMMIQMPIWIALYQSVIQGLAYSPENLFGLSKQLYSWTAVQGMVPLDKHFLWLDLGRGDPFMAVLTGASMWTLQKMSMQPSADSSSQSMQTMMLWMMPLMFGFLALSFPSGLALYWVVSTLIRIVLQYRATGWGSLRVPSSLNDLLPGRAGKVETSAATRRGAAEGASATKTTVEEGAGEEGGVAGSGEAAGSSTASRRRKVRHGKRGDKRKDRRGGRRPRPG